MGWNVVTGLGTPAATKNAGALIKTTVMDVEQQFAPKAGTGDCGTGKELPLAVLCRGWGGSRCPVHGQTDRQTLLWQTPRYCPALSHRLQQEPLSAAARREGAGHKRTVWLKRSGVLWINWILLTALLTCCILTGLGGDYRALEQISIYRSTQILGFNKNILWLRHTADQIQPRLTPGAISLISVG